MVNPMKSLFANASLCFDEKPYLDVIESRDSAALRELAMFRGLLGSDPEADALLLNATNPGINTEMIVVFLVMSSF